MASKLITDREKSTRVVVAVARQHKAKVAEGLATKLAPLLREGEKMPDVALLVELQARLLERDIERSVVADDELDRERKEDKDARLERDEAQDIISGVLTDARDAVKALYGEQGLETVGLAGALPTDSTVMARVAIQAAQHLSKLTSLPKKAGVQIDLDYWERELTEKANLCKTALGNVSREEGETGDALRDKNRITSEYDQGFSFVASGLSNQLRFIGEAEAATKVRPSSRRPGRTVQPGEPSEEDDTGVTPPVPAEEEDTEI